MRFLNTFYFIVAVSLNSMEQTFCKCRPVPLSILFQNIFNTCMVFYTKDKLNCVYFYCLVGSLYCWASRMFPVFSIINNAVITVLRGIIYSYP